MNTFFSHHLLQRPLARRRSSSQIGSFFPPQIGVPSFFFFIYANLPLSCPPCYLSPTLPNRYLSNCYRFTFALSPSQQFWEIIILESRIYTPRNSLGSLFDLVWIWCTREFKAIYWKALHTYTMGFIEKLQASMLSPAPRNPLPVTTTPYPRASRLLCQRTIHVLTIHFLQKSSSTG